MFSLCKKAYYDLPNEGAMIVYESILDNKRKKNTNFLQVDGKALAAHLCGAVMFC